MKARPILFSGPMVRAILDGRKVQTRRIVKPQPQMVTDHSIEPWQGDSAALLRLLTENKHGCPYGQPGDVLWVRETFSEAPDVDHDSVGRVLYSADGESYGKCKPSIFMPRSYSRITLEIESIRVERLQDISEEDAVAEGIGTPRDIRYAVQDGFKPLWQSINGPESWSANPWVWVVEFRPHLMSVDEFLKQREEA